MSHREDLAAQLDSLETQLAEQLRYAEATRAQIREIQAQLQPIAAIDAREALTPGPQSPIAKVALFRSLFRGREDVFPRLWVSTRGDRKGYSPVCANERNRALCDKFKIKCAECPNRRFAPMDDQAVLDHLQGRHVIGVYPLLLDETCWFLAADFDGEGWNQDATALLETCRRHDVPAALERSRSGEGAHLWIFFSAPVIAATARKLGCFLLTETMNRRPQLSMTSYDRLFPNQDTMPQGGFGNLIALPLQQDARQNGNTLFLDRCLDPYPDPWIYLANLGRMSPAQVDTLVDAATRQGKVLGIRFDPLDDGLDETPWERPPSGKPKRKQIEGEIPPRVKAMRAHQLFVEKTNLPAGLHAEIKRLAAFQNPEFYQKQAMRFSTAGIPRVICAAEEHPAHITLPRGCEDELQGLLAEHRSSLDIEERRCLGEPLEVAFHGNLTEVQQAAVNAFGPHDLGIFVAPPGTGKTVFGAHMIALRGVNTLVLVHRRPLLDQWCAQLQTFLGLGKKEVGQIGGGKQKVTGRIDVAMIQSLASREGVLDLVANYGQVIVDECHHAPAVSFERVMREVKARYVLGLTATPYRRDGLQRLLHFQCGPIRHQVHPLSQEGGRPFANRLIVRETRFFAQGTIQDLYAALVADPHRNALIIQDVRRALSEGRSPIVLTERRDHLDLLVDALKDVSTHVVVLHGGVCAKARRTALLRLAEVPPSEARLILATGRYIGEGFDDSRLDTLFMAMPIAWKGTLIQYAGRLHRLHPGKEEVRIYDYLDDSLAVFRKMFEKRMKGYRAMGYQVNRAVDLPLLGAEDSRPHSAPFNAC